MKPNFSEDVRREVLEDNYYICQYCGQDKIFDFHHRLRNSKANQRKYPKFLQSRANCAGLCRKCHESGKIRRIYNVTEEYAQIREGMEL